MKKKILFIEYPKCTTCQKAKKWLIENKIEFETRHILEQNPKAEELRKWIETSGIEIKKFFNVTGLKYKEKNLKNILPQMSDEEKISVLASDGMLVKRPLLIIENEKILVGFKTQEWANELQVNII